MSVSSKLIDTISETDGSHLKIDYDGAGRVIGMRQPWRAASLATPLSPMVRAIPASPIPHRAGDDVLHHDGAGQLVRITAPAAYAGRWRRK